MAVSAGIILRKSKLYEEAVSTRKKTEALLQISELMSADLQSDKIMAKICQAAYMLVSCEVILLYMVDEAAGELVCEVGKVDGMKGSRIPLGHGVAGHTALTGRSLNISDAQNDWRFDPSEHSQFSKNRIQTILCLPVKDYLGKNVGVLEIINKRSSNGSSVVPFSSEDEDVLNSLAYTAGAVLRKSKLYDEAISRRRQTEALLQVRREWYGGSVEQVWR
jgi:adenylate cyclase